MCNDQACLRVCADRYVAKFPRPKSSKKEHLMHELKTWATLADHHNVARLADLGCEFGMPVLVLQYAGLGNLSEYIRKRQDMSMQVVDDEDQPAPGHAPWLEEPLDWCIQLAHGLQFLHDSCVVHSDIKPQSEPIPECQPCIECISDCVVPSESCAQTCWSFRTRSSQKLQSYRLAILDTVPPVHGSSPSHSAHAIAKVLWTPNIWWYSAEDTAQVAIVHRSNVREPLRSRTRSIVGRLV